MNTLNYAEVLEKYLYRIARGELRDLDPLVPLIPPSVLYMPVIAENSLGKKCNMKLPIVERSSKKYLPIFLRRSHLVASYEKLKVSPQEIRGDTLLEMLPMNFGLLFEPNSSLEVAFSREDLGLVKENNNEVKQEESEVVSKATLPNSLDELLPKPVPLVEVNKLEDALRSDLSLYKEVLEAFFIPHTSSYSDAILGLLREEMDDERRYDLCEAVAKTSTNFYGYAGAIEIFDDLLDPNSKAWTQFKSEVPFFKRDKITDKIEISKTVIKDSRKEGLLGSLDNLRKTGLKIFYS